MMKRDDFQTTIDSSFAMIQRYIEDNESLDGDSKENMISLCIECNDMILRMYENQKKKKKVDKVKRI